MTDSAVSAPDVCCAPGASAARAALTASLARLDTAIGSAIEQFERSLESGAHADPNGIEHITHDETERLLSVAPLAGHWSIPAGDAGVPKFAAPFEGSRFTELQRLFELTAAELDALLVAASVDLDPRYERLFGYLQDDVTRRRPTAGTVARLAGTAAEREWEALEWFGADAPLVRARLVRLVADAASCPSALCSRYVLANEIVVRYLADVDERDQALASFCTLCIPSVRAETVHAWRRHPELAAFTTAVLHVGGTLTIAIVGPHSGERTQLAEAIAAACHLPLLVVDVPRLMNDEQADRLDAALLSARLRGAVIYLDGLDQLSAQEQTVLRRALVDGHARYGSHLIVSSNAAWPSDERSPENLVGVLVRMPDADEREFIWHGGLAQFGATADALDVADIARVFSLSETQIQAAVGACVPRMPAEGTIVSRRTLFQAARAQMPLKLPRAVVKIEPTAVWGDLVLPADVAAQLRELCAHARHRHTVFERWGFGRRSSRGTGLTALFSGGPGTGKTTACEVISAALGRTLLKIDLSQVVSKYIGDTEKQLDEVFTIAEQAAAILLFDEADTLFGKRTQISDAHDRYANIEVGYLLQKIEEYAGIAVLATNLHANIDPAFARRLHFTVEFPFPDERSRAEIWRVAIPDGAPVANDLEFDVLARRFPVAGGSIRNIAVAAAILAASDARPIALCHVLHAARREYQKLGKMPPDANFFGQVPVA